MFHDPNRSDFDSMSQEELIEWLETLAQRQTDEEPELRDDIDQALDELNPGAPPELLDDEEWSAWIADDEDLQQELPRVIPTTLQTAQDLEEDDDETPTALPIIEEGVGDDTTDPLTSPEEITIAKQPAQAPPPAETVAADDVLASQLDRVAEEDSADPLDWLERLANEVSDAAAMMAKADGALVEDDDFDDEYEDNEALDDADDESLYSRRFDEPMTFLETLAGLEDGSRDEFSTQSMAPLPDMLIPASDAEGDTIDAEVELGKSAAASAPQDSLIAAFLIQDHQADLEAWYAARLQAVATGADTATQAPATRPTAARSAEPVLNLDALPTPPPGLTAGFNSARRKIAKDKLPEALADYETLLRANIGLDLIIKDMNWLIEQDRFRDNPAVHRVLGDALMRQGSLQEALDVYRRALKLL